MFATRVHLQLRRRHKRSIAVLASEAPPTGIVLGDDVAGERCRQTIGFGAVWTQQHSSFIVLVLVSVQVRLVLEALAADLAGEEAGARVFAEVVAHVEERVAAVASQLARVLAQVRLHHVLLVATSELEANGAEHADELGAALDAVALEMVTQDVAVEVLDGGKPLATRLTRRRTHRR